MGLDFTIYKKKVNETYEQAWDAINKELRESGYTTTSERELAYGRKSWELVYELAPDYQEYFDSKEDPLVSKERWDSLMTKSSEIAPKLDKIWDAFNKEENAPTDYTEFVFGDEEKRLIAEYEYWYNKTFDTEPTLGYFFSVGYIKNFWDANPEVQKVFEDPKWEVRASVSY